VANSNALFGQTIAMPALWRILTHLAILATAQWVVINYALILIPMVAAFTFKFALPVKTERLGMQGYLAW